MQWPTTNSIACIYTLPILNPGHFRYRLYQILLPKEHTVQIFHTALLNCMMCNITERSRVSKYISKSTHQVTLPRSHSHTRTSLHRSTFNRIGINSQPNLLPEPSS